MEDNNLLKEVQRDYKQAQKPKKKPKKTKAEMQLEKIESLNSLKRKIILIMIAIVLTVIGVAYMAERYVDWRADHQWQFPIKWIGLVKETRREVVAENNPIEDISGQDEEIVKPSWTGKVSYYSHGDGCVGCHPQEIMKNGEKFDENAMTLAFNHLPMNTEVRVTNVDNGANIIAKVTDTGGFEKYNRIADLSKGLMTELNAVTDVSTIKIEVL